jgi:hypothetical protein
VTAVAVSRLTVRSLADRAVRAQARVEDALRVAPAAPERLLVIRRLALGRIAADARPERWHARTAGALAEQGARAVHGAHPGAAEAGAVWFRSADEARALLLAELAAGRRPSAWFWRLAVRDWREAPLEVWLPRWIAAAERDPETGVALARAVVAAAEVGLLPAIVAAMAGRLVAGAAPLRFGRSDQLTLPPAPPAAEVSNRIAADASAARLARRTMLTLPAAARLAIQAALAAPGQAVATVRWLARIAVLAAAPDLASSPSVLDAATEALVQEARAAIAAEAPPQRPSPSLDNGGGATTRAPRLMPEPEEAPAPRRAGAPAEPSDARPALSAPQVIELNKTTQLFGEITSSYAGILLLVRPLWRLGLPEWLDERPAARVDGFARQLLAAVARRMGADDGDVVLEALAARPDGDWGDAITAWRVGLDRWLRRTARAKLADVAKRRGGVLLAGDRLDVRFPLAAADLRLRRHALDLDPLWTPWLGLSIRYHFQDQPLQ